MVGRSDCTSDQSTTVNGDWLIVVNHTMLDKRALVAESAWAGASAIRPSTRRSEKTGLTDSPPRSLSGPRRLTTVSYLQLRPFVSHPLHAGFSPVHLTFLSRLRQISASRDADAAQTEGGGRDGDVPPRAGDEGRRLG